MPAKTPCAYCGQTGFVRTEHVITGTTSVIHLYCGSCGRSWIEGETDRRLSEDAATKPDPNRDLG